MTTVEIIGCAISVTAAIVSITALVLTVRQAQREGVVRYQLSYPLRDDMIVTEKPLTEAEFDALRAKLETEYSQYRDGRAMPLDVLDDEGRSDA